MEGDLHLVGSQSLCVGQGKLPGGGDGYVGWGLRLHSVSADSRLGPLPEKAAVGNSRKPSLSRCLWGCDLNDTNQLCRNTREGHSRRGNRQGKGPTAGTGLAHWKEQKEGSWFRKCGVGEAHASRASSQQLGRSLGCSGAEAARYVTSGVQSRRKCWARVRSLG